VTEPGGEVSRGSVRPDDLHLDVVEGEQAVAEIRQRLDDLALSVGAPITARCPWLMARIGSDPAVRPWAVLLSGRDGQLRAAAVLLDVPAEEGWLTELAGGGDGHRAALLARDDHAGELLVRTLGELLVSRSSDSEICLGPLPLDEMTQRLVAVLPSTAVIEAPRPIPVVRRAESTQAGGYLTHGLRRTLRKACNRMAADGVSAEITFIYDPRSILELAPLMAAAHQRRDHDHGLASYLDTEAGSRLWHGRLRRLAEAGDVELAVLHLDGALAAYVIGLVDPPAYRVLEGRFVTEWARYSPGRVLESTVLQRFLDDGSYDVLDWMTGVAPDSLLAANDEEPRITVRLSRPVRREAVGRATTSAGSRRSLEPHRR
jgi:hypothetical protein